MKFVKLNIFIVRKPMAFKKQKPKKYSLNWKNYYMYTHCKINKGTFIVR